MNEKSNLELFLAEFIGTFLFVSIGLASVAVLVLGLSDINYPWMTICWGIGIAIAIYLVGDVSGAHLNPAVTISLMIWSGFDKKKSIVYIIGQILGAFAAAALVYYFFSFSILNHEAKNSWIRGTFEGCGAMGIFVTAPTSGLPMFKAFIVEAFLTMVLILTIYAVTDAENGSAPSAGIGAITIGASVVLCGIGIGPLTGFAMNPARDLGPRIFVRLLGWSKYAWGENFYGLIVPIFAPIIGGIIAGGIYKHLIKKYF